MEIGYNHQHTIILVLLVLQLCAEMEPIVLAKVEGELVHTTEVLRDGINVKFHKYYVVSHKKRKL